MGLCYNLGARSIDSLGKFPHIELRQSLARPLLAALGLIASLSSRIPSLFQNDSIYRSSSAGVRNQAGEPIASDFNFKKVSM
jgi:hypothetical protein